MGSVYRLTLRQLLGAVAAPHHDACSPACP